MASFLKGLFGGKDKAEENNTEFDINDETIMSTPTHEPIQDASEESFEADESSESNDINELNLEPESEIEPEPESEMELEQEQEILQTNDSFEEMQEANIATDEEVIISEPETQVFAEEPSNQEEGDGPMM